MLRFTSLHFALLCQSVCKWTLSLCTKLLVKNGIWLKIAWFGQNVQKRLWWSSLEYNAHTKEPNFTLWFHIILSFTFFHIYCEMICGSADFGKWPYWNEWAAWLWQVYLWFLSFFLQMATVMWDTLICVTQLNCTYTAACLKPVHIILVAFP